MPDGVGKILICSCEDTMPLDTSAVQRACRGAELRTAHQLCRAEAAKFRSAAGEAEPLTVGCTQESPLFNELAAEVGRERPITYVNLRERAGWSKEASKAGPKMAALIAVAREPLPNVPFVTLQSEGVILVYGLDERAVEAGALLQEHLDVTVLLKPPAAIAPSRAREFPIAKGRVQSAKGHFGGFELTIDDFAEPVPSSRTMLNFGPSRDGALSRCDVILDLSGGIALFPGDGLREGYLRIDPNDPVAVLKAVLKARDLVGTFEKPRYVTFAQELCAHSRSRIVGCTRCLDVCPAGAIAPAGDHVSIDANLCAGCGQCASVCPTGAASYALPPADVLLIKLRTLLTTYRDAGGDQPTVLVHDEAHGTELINALARFGGGLPANVLPVAVNEVTQIGLEAIAAAFAYGASAMRILSRARPRHDVTALTQTLELAQPILVGLGLGGQRISVIATDDPDVLEAELRADAPLGSVAQPTSFLFAGAKRELLRFALRELHRASSSSVDVIPLPAGAPLGSIEIDAAGCTLCLSCVAACPTGALTEDFDRPLLRFAEDACVQCGLCKATCPEKVISLKPQIDFRAATAPARVLKTEEPFCCIRCGKPFGVRSTIERVTAKLATSHWMFKESPKRLEAIKMCDDCRVAVISAEDFDPYGAPPRPPVRTSEDYLREREEKKRVEEEPQ
jgi:ferredoxin